MIGVIGAGVLGARVVEELVANGQAHVYVHDSNPVAARRVVDRSSQAAHKVSAVDVHELFGTNVVVLACAPAHAKAARRLLEAGVSVVSWCECITWFVGVTRTHDVVTFRHH
jgi:saccharopine dehydrogenase-like NADP-dependent oxidoreductase